MIKNQTGQVIGAQMVSATDGSAFTGSVTVAVTGDAGTQATGSVGSGACTHEGNGFHTYAPAQAETNYDHVAFTFTGSGAVPVTVQVYTGTAAVTPPTNFSSLDIDASGHVLVQGTINDLDSLNDLDAAGIRTAVGLASANLDTQLAAIDNFLDTEVAAILVDTGTTLDGKLNTIDTVVDAIKAKTDQFTFTQTGEVDANVQSINDNALTGGGASAADYA